MKNRSVVTNRVARRNAILLSAGLAALGVSRTYAADATWVTNPTNGNWVTVPGGEINWSTGASTFPGAVSGNTSADIATFNGTSSTTAILINAANLNIGGITFDGAPSAYTIGTTGGNALVLSNGGAITLASTVTAATTQTINAPLVLAGNYAITNNSTTNASSLFAIGGAISGSSGNQTLTINGSSTSSTNTVNIISGAISNGSATSLALTKSGGNTWSLAGTATNTYTGLTTVSGGMLFLNKTAGLGSGGGAIVGDIQLNSGTIKLLAANQIADTSNLTLNGGSFDPGGKNETVGSITMTNSGSTVYTSNGVPNLNTLTVTGAFNMSAGSLTINSGGGTVNVGSFTMNGGSFTFGVGSATQSLVVGAGGFTLGSGLFATVQNSAAAGGVIKLNGDFTSTAASSTNGMLIGSASGSTGGSIDLQGGNRTFNVQDGSAALDLFLSVNLVNGALTKANAGTMRMAGINTYAGATTVNGGTLIEDFNTASGSASGAVALSNRIATTSNLVMGSGNFVILGHPNAAAGTATASYSTNGTTITVASTAGLSAGQVITGTGIPANAYIRQILDGTRFTLSSTPTSSTSNATINLTGSATYTNAQTFNSLSLTSATGSSVDANLNGATSVTLDLRGTGGTTLIDRGAGATVDFRASGGGLGTTALIKVHDVNGAAGNLAGWATANGTDYAANDGSDNVVAFSGYTTIGAAGSTIADGATTNVKITSPGTSGNISLDSTTTTINTLTQGTTNAATIDTAGKTLRFGASGGVLLPSGNGAVTIGASSNSGSLTAGGADGVAGEIVLTNFGTAAITVNSAITNNAGGAVLLTKAGSGPLTLAGTNSYTGPTYLTGGNTTITSNASLGDPATAAMLTINGATLTSALTIGLNNGAAGTNDRPITIGNNGATFNPTGNTLTVSGAVSGSGAITKSGVGTLVLSGNNAVYAGAINVGAGSLVAGSNTALGVASVGTTVTAGADLLLADGVTVMGETVTINGNGNGNMGALSTAISATPVNATWAGPVILGSADARVGGHLNGTLNVAGVIDDGPSNYNLIISSETSGSNTAAVVLSGVNTYGGQTKITRGILRLGANDTLPVGTILDVHDNSLTGDKSTFDMAGFSQTLGGLKNSATNTANAALIINAALNTSVLMVNEAAASEYNGQITGNVALTKNGSAILTLSGNNSYTGNTTVNVGTLALKGAFTNNLAGSNQLIVNTGASLDVTGLTSGRIVLASGQTLKGKGNVAGAVTVALNSRIAPGSSVGLLTTGDETWNGGGVYEFEILNPGTAGATNGGTPGTDWDKLATGALSIASTSANQFRVEMVGDRSAWATGTYNWIIASTAGISGYAGIDQFQVDTSRFVGAQPGDTYSVLTSGNDVVLSYTATTAVPEPGTLAFLGGAAMAMLGRRRRQV